MTEIRKALPAGLANCKSVGTDTLEFIVSHEAPDLAGDVVVQRGIKSASQRLPAQVDHSGRMADTVGYWTDLKCHGDFTTARLNLVQRGISPMADLVRGLADAGVKLAASIGFTSPSVEPLKPKGFKFKETVLHEISVVVVPCQPLAVQIAKSFGLEAVIAPEPKAPAASGDLTSETIKRAKAAILAANRAARK